MGAYVVDVRAVAQPLGAADSEKAVVDLTLRTEALRDRLDHVLGPGRYSYRFEPATQAGRAAVYCHLQVGGATRTGIGARSELRIARKEALSGAARAFGIGKAGAGPILTEYSTDHVFPDRTREAVEAPADHSYWTPTGEPPEDCRAGDGS